MGDTQALDIARLGAQGDGVADLPSGQVFVPYALPGERVQADVRGERARLIAVIDASPDRVAPVCRHFTHCGGCAVQHLRMPAYLAWKRDLVTAAFAARGIDAPIGNVATVGPGARRRASFSARRTGRGVMLGFHEAKGVELVDVQECPVTASAIVRALPALRRLVEPLMSRRAPGRVVVTLAANGLDV
ncbi:MAG: class I SAM-dependent RNA methyltransferase, partial [Hyphomicrobium sp.]|nr:class I SAM-dependent RNA methyltransferase [Hyphomicrobium sp.]